MPISYNTAGPTPDTKNTITSIATELGVRDYLLNLNLTSRYPQIPTSINGSPKVGEPVLDLSVNGDANTIPNHSPIDEKGIGFKEDISQLNLFTNTSSNSNELIGINYNLPLNNGDFPNSSWPIENQTYPTSPNDDIKDYGILAKTTEANYINKNIGKNLYTDNSQQVDSADLINLSGLEGDKHNSGYLDSYGALNLGGGGAIRTMDIIGSVISGQGLGIGDKGILPNFDIRSTLAGRVLGATGVINDTKLGIIGGRQLALAFANNAGYNVQQEVLGSFNIKDNVLGLIKGEGLAGFRPSYKITIPKLGTNRTLDAVGDILGFTLPKSYLGDEGSIFQTENGDVGNIERANSMILNTGKGQVDALLKNMRANLLGTNAGGTDDPSKSLFRSGYAPAFKNNRDELQITNAIVYAFSKDGANINLLSMDGGIPSLTYEREEQLSNDGFKSPEELGVGPRGNNGYDDRKISDVGFTWTSINTDKLVNSVEEFDILTGNKKSLLVKTQQLFNSKGMKNIVTSKGDMGKHSSQIQTANGGGFSKGNAVMSSQMFDETTGRYMGGGKTADETYCRSWTTLDRYDTRSKLVRSGTDGIEDKGNSKAEFNGVGINDAVPFRFNTQGSILDGYGTPKIGPYADDKSTDIKKFMFSIENLAWAGGAFNLLPESERGSGDLSTGKRGRIMWFPPYDIQFSENSNVNWEANNFIGRGESVYTYNNTERAGNLSFRVVVDHPSYVNSFRGSDGPDDSYVNSFWAGCIDPNSKMGERLTVSERSEALENEEFKPFTANIPNETPPTELSVYFPNDNAHIEPKYENGLNLDDTTIDYSSNATGEGQGLGQYKANYTPGSHNNSKDSDGEGWPDRYNYGLNFSFDGSSSNTNISYAGADSNQLNGYYDPATQAAIIIHLIEVCPNCVATITGFASKQGDLKYNLKLAKDRALALKAEVKREWWPTIKGALPNLTDSDFDRRFVIGTTEQINNSGCKSCKGIPRAERDAKCPTDTLACKLDRRATINFKFSKELASENIVIPVIDKKETKRRVTNKIKDKFYNESRYFEKLTDADKFVFDSFREKIRYFHPGFHSTTPEGLNSRLTFLLQCTRQGETLEELGATNLAFGRAPVCILRIGDFYNTKIIIDNISIDYEPLVWDLNPEGIGVQPMIANVSMSFKFIGGSSLMGPINKLQNALSFNYFANSQVYDPRADYISSNTSSEGVETYKLENGTRDLSKSVTILETREEKVEEKQSETAFMDTTTYNAPTNMPLARGIVGDLELTSFSRVEMDYDGEFKLSVGMNFVNDINRSQYVKKSGFIRLIQGNKVISNVSVDLNKLDNLMANGAKGPIITFKDNIDKTGKVMNKYELHYFYNGKKVCSTNISVSANKPFSYNNKIN